MRTEEQNFVHKEFRKYLRTKEGHKGNMLNTLIKATEVSLPALITRYVRPDFECIYDDIYSIEEMLLYAAKLKSDEILASQSGYISWKAIDAYIRFYAQKHDIDLTAIKQPEVKTVDSTEAEDEEQERYEGRLTEAKVLRRQRNRAARQQCLKASGYMCYVCGFNFEKTYGDIGKNFLEVHHTKPLATYDDEHPIPQSELVALCSNCHSMVHSKREELDVNELKEMLQENKNKPI